MFRQKQRQKKMIEYSFGKNPLDGYSYYNAENRLDRVKRFHHAICEVEGHKKGEVDDITWNDLEMDQIFLRINHTNSFIGEQVLYHKMHLLNKGKDSQVIEDFERKIDHLKNKSEFRLDLEIQLNHIGKLEQVMIRRGYLLRMK